MTHLARHTTVTNGSYFSVQIHSWQDLYFLLHIHEIFLSLTKCDELIKRRFYYYHWNGSGHLWHHRQDLNLICVDWRTQQRYFWCHDLLQRKEKTKTGHGSMNVFWLVTVGQQQKKTAVKFSHHSFYYLHPCFSHSDMSKYLLWHSSSSSVERKKWHNSASLEFYKGQMVGCIILIWHLSTVL